MLYTIYLEQEKLGTTKFEKADAPMGVVFGKIQFINNNIDYNYIKKYCVKNSIDLAYDYPKDKVIATKSIRKLKIVNQLGKEIKGAIGNQISGMNSDGFEISLEGIPYPFYEEEFPHHVQAYEK